MGGRGRNGWRWLITALVIGVAAVGLGVVLRAQNLGAAANVAQLLSLLPLVASMLAWARERHKTPDAPEDENKTLNELIDTIEERVARVENSIAFHNALRSGLLEMLDRLTSSIAQLTGERRSLRDRIEAGHPGPPAGAPGLDGEERERPEDEITRLRGALRETERGLKGAERMRGQVHRRLEESERRRTEADRLLRESRAHATEARRRLTELGVGRAAAEVTPAPVPRPRVLLGAGIMEAGLMEEAGERTTDEILRRVDDVLREETTVLRRVHGDLAGGALPVHRRPAGFSARRRVRWVTAGVGLPVIGLALAVVVVHLVGTLPGTPGARSTAPARPQGPAPDPARTNLWPRKVGGPIEGDPAVAGGVVYIGSSDSKVYALDAATGAERWSYQTANIVRSSPAVADGVVYVGSKDFTVYALDAATGEKRWAYKTGGEVDSGPAVADGVVYVGSKDSTVYALDAATGAKRWSHRTGGLIRSSPTVAGGVVYVGSNDFKVYALDATTGAERWSYETGDDVDSSPAVIDGVVYVGSDDSKIYALDATTGEKRWAYKTGDEVDSSPAVTGGVVYVGSDDSKIYALDATTGEKRWATKTGGVIESDPAVAGGVVYVGSNDSTVYALDAATGAGRWSYETGDEVDSGPTVTGGVVYVGGNDFTMYALDAATGRGHRG